jgi:NAD(P)-dependent dehydrogenase (short-subunit alcohol dehydrogenase family)
MDQGSPMPFSLVSKTALITGAGSGIGQSIAEVFAQAGAHVWVADVRVETAQVTVDRIRAGGGKADALALDVTSDADFSAAMERVPVVDVLVANAGVGHVGTLLTTTVADLERVFAVNVQGVLRTLKAWMPGMVERRRGSVVVMASAAGLEGLVDRFAYSASKHAVVGMTRCAAIDHATSGVRVNCICPGRTETPFVQARLKEYPDPEAAYREMCSTQAQQRMGKPEEIAHAALFLASDEASYVTGASLCVDGGWMAGMFTQR